MRVTAERRIHVCARALTCPLGDHASNLLWANLLHQHGLARLWHSRTQLLEGLVNLQQTAILDVCAHGHEQAATGTHLWVVDTTRVMQQARTCEVEPAQS